MTRTAATKEQIYQASTTQETTEKKLLGTNFSSKGKKGRLNSVRREKKKTAIGGRGKNRQDKKEPHFLGLKRRNGIKTY